MSNITNIVFAAGVLSSKRAAAKKSTAEGTVEDFGTKAGNNISSGTTALVKNALHTSPSDKTTHYTVELSGGTSAVAHVYTDGTGKMWDASGKEVAVNTLSSCEDVSDVQEQGIDGTQT